MQPNYLQHQNDLELMLEGARMSREIFLQPEFDSIRTSFIFPEKTELSREDQIDFIRRKAETIYHPVGTCKMGVDDMAVVDPELKVRGLEGLRVIDASVMPTLIVVAPSSGR